MDEKLRHHAESLAEEMIELYGLGFSDDDMRQQCRCLSQRAFARAFPRFRYQPEADELPEAALLGEDETPPAMTQANTDERAKDETPFG